MYLQVGAIVKQAVFSPADSATHRKAATKIKMFDLELGDDIELKFPGEIVLRPGTPINIEGLFAITKFQNYTTLTGIEGKYAIQESGKLVFNGSNDAEKKGGEKIEK
jgi:hypothetical protein